jgi:transposase
MDIRGLAELFPFDGFLIEEIVFSVEIVQVNLRRDKRRRLPCPVCSASMKPYRETRQCVRDLPLGTAGHVYVVYPAVLARCPRCRDTYTLHPPGIAPHAKATDRLMRYVSLLARHLPLSRVAEVAGLPAATARRWDKRVLEEDMPPVDLDGVAVLLVDEKHLGPSLGFVTLVLDGDTGDLLHLAPGKKKESLRSFFDKLGDMTKEGVLCVCEGRAGQYKATVEANCPQAMIVFDKFHIKKNLNDVVDTVRRQEWHKASEEEKATIKGQRYNLLRAPEKNTPEQARSLKRLLGLNEALHAAYILKEAFDKVWGYTYRRSAEKYLAAWKDWAVESGVKPLVRFARSIWKSKNHVLAYVDWPVTTGRLECLNGLTERILRRCCGLTDMQYLFLKIRQAAQHSFHLQT